METLQRAGHVVIPASSRESGLRNIKTAGYHLLIIGATIPVSDRQAMAELSRALHPTSKIISVESPKAPALRLAHRRVVAGDEAAMLLAVTSLVSGDAESDLEERRR